MVKRLLLLVSLLGALPALAQHPAKPDPTQLYSLVDGKTIVKTNPFSDLFGNLNLKVERILARGLSAQLSVYYTSKESESVRQNGAFHSYSSVFYVMPLAADQSKFFTLRPQLRWYLNEGKGHGFYVEGYYQFQHSSFSNQQITEYYPSKEGKSMMGGRRSTAMASVSVPSGSWGVGRISSLIGISLVSVVAPYGGALMVLRCWRGTLGQQETTPRKKHCFVGVFMVWMMGRSIPSMTQSIGLRSPILSTPLIS